MTDTQRTTASTRRLTSCFAFVCCAGLLVSPSDALAKHRAHVSQDLKDRVQAGDNTDTSVMGMSH